ncbi:MAG TPA: MoaD/ThiS family protein [Ohtaekwangia sp.]|nr:MoaD/ThiS family protein [Ohtaekwangia sp.]
MEKTERKYVIRAFGIAKEIMGSREVEVKTMAETAGDLRSFLEEKYPELNSLKSFFIAVNNEYADDNLVLASSDEIAVIPPVSGG